jgi:hypothetical protein
MYRRFLKRKIVYDIWSFDVKSERKKKYPARAMGELKIILKQKETIKKNQGFTNFIVKILLSLNKIISRHTNNCHARRFW